MLVVTEEEAAVALTLVAAHGVDTDLLAAPVIVLTLIHICGRRGEGGKSHQGWGAGINQRPHSNTEVLGYGHLPLVLCAVLP